MMELFKPKRKILMLDKDTRVLGAVDEILSTGEWDVSITFDPNAVYDLAKDQQPDLVILDYLLIDKGCTELCREFKDDPQLRSIPIIVVTAYKNRKIKETAYKCDALFIKPLDFSVLANRMDYLMAS